MANVEAVGLNEVVLRLTEAPQRILTIARQTLNRGAQRGRTQVVSAVRSEVTLPAAYVRGRVQIVPASGSVLQSKVYASREPILLSRYSPKEQFLVGRDGKKKRQGLTVRVSTGAPQQYLPFAFLITVKKRNGDSNTLLVTARREKNPVTGKPKVHVRYGPSVDQIFQTYRPDILEELQTWSLQEMRRRLSIEAFGPNRIVVDT